MRGTEKKASHEHSNKNERDETTTLGLKHDYNSTEITEPQDIICSNWHGETMTFKNSLHSFSGNEEAEDTTNIKLGEMKHYSSQGSHDMLIHNNISRPTEDDDYYHIRGKPTLRDESTRGIQTSVFKNSNRNIPVKRDYMRWEEQTTISRLKLNRQDEHMGRDRETTQYTDTSRERQIRREDQSSRSKDNNHVNNKSVDKAKGEKRLKQKNPWEMKPKQNPWSMTSKEYPEIETKANKRHYVDRDQPKSESLELCWWHSKNRCKFGKNCWFPHEVQPFRERAQ